MSGLTLVNLSIIVDELLDHRAQRLAAEAPRAAAFYLPLLAARQAELARYVGRARPKDVTADLAAAARRQDDHARALRRHVEALIADAADVREPARRVRDVLLPHKRASGRSYAVRASLRLRVEAKLPALEGDLARLPPLPTGAAFADRLQAWLAESDAVDALLTARADARVRRRAEAAPKHLQGNTVALLRRLRAALADERRVTPASADLDAFLFARFDALTPRPKARAVA